MCRFHIKVNPNYIDHPYMKHKIQSLTQCMPVCPPTTKLKYNITAAVPDEIPSKDWLTFNEFIVKSLLVGIIYFCLLIIIKFSRDFLYWKDSPRRQVKKPDASREYAETLIRVLNFMVSSSNITKYEKSQPSSTMACTQTPPQEVMINK